MKRFTVNFNAKVTPVKPLNDEFTLCKCYVMALDKNRNLSFISKDVADAALPTIYNIPVIGHLYTDDEGEYHMGGHDMSIIQDEDGQYKFKSICVPYGVVPLQDNVHYEDIKEPNGDINTYLVADVILWTGRFPELYEAIYDKETYFGQSMEINVTKYAPLDEDKNYTDILEYAYSALCLLGKSDNPEFHKEPCFPMARIDAYEFLTENEHFTELMAQFKKELALCFESENAENGEKNVDKDTITDAEKANDTDEKPMNSFENHDDNTVGTVKDSAFSSTYGERYKAIENALPRFHEADDDGVIRDIRFWICDFDDTHVFVTKEEYTKDRGFNETKGRFAYTFNEADKTAVISDNFEEVYVKWLTKDELARLESIQAQYGELLKYKEKRERDDFESAIDIALEEFNDLEGNEMFSTIVEKKYTYESVDAIRDACYIVRGKYSVPSSRRRGTLDQTVPVGTKSETPNEYDEFFAKYGKRK